MSRLAFVHYAYWTTVFLGKEEEDGFESESYILCTLGRLIWKGCSSAFPGSKMKTEAGIYKYIRCCYKRELCCCCCFNRSSSFISPRLYAQWKLLMNSGSLIAVPIHQAAVLRAVEETKKLEIKEE